MPGTGILHERELLDALAALAAEPFSGTVWRTTWATRDPLTGSAAGGRWHPPNAFEALYTSLEADGSLAEVYYHLARAPVFSSAHVKLYSLQVETEKTLRLTGPVLAHLGLDEKALKAADYARSQAIGAAAYFLEFDSILVASARWDRLHLIVFLDRLEGSRLEVGESREVNWPAWKESQRH
jgi:hypothetical protein